MNEADDPETPEVRLGEGDRFFVSPSQGLILLEPGGAVWECDLSGYLITDVPQDAVEWGPKKAFIDIIDGSVYRGVKVEFEDDETGTGECW